MTGVGSAVWRVDAERQAAFAAMSGDRNPLHVDPIAARRQPFGRVAVHGLHVLLDTLERVVAATERTPRRVRCTFRHPVGVGDELTTTIGAPDPSEVSATVVVDVWTAAEVEVELGDPLPERHNAPPSPTVVEPEDHSIDQLRGRSGSIAVAADTGSATTMFPRLHDRIGPARLAELISLTRLVGMHIPGLHSLFSGLDVTLHDTPRHDTARHDTAEHDRLTYAVAKADERFSQVVVDVAGPSVRGSVTAFVRPTPIDQTIGDVRPAPNEFAGQRWLVIGGSRGLGAAAVQLLGAGGADVRFTYRTGVGDAAALAASTAGATAHQLDVHDAGAALDRIVTDTWRPTHLAYMATPPIFDGMRGVYSPTLHERFVACYVDAFVELVDQLVDRLDADRLRGILWPSSTAVDHDVPGLAEYADAKRAGEQACRDLAAAHPALVVHAPRLPRLLTDQTTSFVPTEFGDTAVEVLAGLRGVTG